MTRPDGEHAPPVQQEHSAIQQEHSAVAGYMYPAVNPWIPVILVLLAVAAVVHELI